MNNGTNINAVPVLARLEKYRLSVEGRRTDSKQYDYGVVAGIMTAQSFIAKAVHGATNDDVKVLHLDVVVEDGRHSFRDISNGAEYTLSDLLDKEEIIIVRKRKL